MARNPDLEAIDPRTAVEFYLEDRQNEVSKQTLRAHDNRLSYFCDWCESNGITNLNELSGRDLRRYKIYRAEDVKPVTAKSYLDTLRVFLRFCVSIDAVHSDLPDKVQSPEVQKKNQAKTTHINAERAKSILEYLRKYEYASIEHTIFELLWHTGIRRGALVALDLDDWNRDERFLALQHRPEEATPLKNGNGGERPVAVSESVATVLHDYIETNRIEQEDEHRRKPLFTSKHGRIHGQTVQKYIYKLTTPCYINEECPHDRDPQHCDATQSHDTHHKCPSSVSPHDIRRSSITHFLKEGGSVDQVGDRTDVSREVLEKHYNQMTNMEKMEQRRDFFETI